MTQKNIARMNLRGEKGAANPSPHAISNPTI